MSGENTENPQDSGEDATAEVPAPVPTAPAAEPALAPGVEPFAVPAPETVDIPDAAEAIENFEVPPPPTFGAVPPPPSPEPVIPPAPSSPVSPAPRQREVWSSDSTWSSASAHKRESVPATAAQAAAHQAVEAREEATAADFVHPVPGDTAQNSYRGWTITIFVGLAVLLIAAIAGIAYLSANSPWSQPGAGEDRAPISSVSSEPLATEEEEPAVDDEPTAEEEPDETVAAPSGRCGELCADVFASVGDEVVGADGAHVWHLSEAWETADSAALPAVETVHAEYESTAGTLVFTVWGFASDAATDDAYAALVDERGDADYTDSVYDNGRGLRNDFSSGDTSSILWSVTDDETQPWVLEVEGSDGEAVTQFYLALPI